MTLTTQDQSFAQIKGRVAKVLLEHAGDGTKGNNRLTQRDIATRLGIGWDVVHQSLKSLYDEGVIRIERNRIIINKELIQQAALAV
jgi:DNA-binding GntR family transcriptional regulator